MGDETTNGCEGKCTHLELLQPAPNKLFKDALFVLRETLFVPRETLVVLRETQPQDLLKAHS